MSGMNGHPTREEDFDLYALGALEGEEKRAIELHLAGCRDCARKLAEAQGRIALLALAAPPAAPSDAVKQRLMSQDPRQECGAHRPGRGPPLLQDPHRGVPEDFSADGGPQSSSQSVQRWPLPLFSCGTKTAS